MGNGLFGARPSHEPTLIYCQYCTSLWPITVRCQDVSKLGPMLIRDWHLMASWNQNIFRVTGSLWGESIDHRRIPLQRPVTRGFDVFFDLRLNKRLSKQSRRRWFETPSGVTAMPWWVLIFGIIFLTEKQCPDVADLCPGAKYAPAHQQWPCLRISVCRNH